jgi:hypothetical protein
MGISNEIRIETSNIEKTQGNTNIEVRQHTRQNESSEKTLSEDV